MYIKGFDKNLKCRGLQFEVGKTYDTGYTKDLRLCSNTVFHFCDTLEKVHKYYYCGNEENRYCEIEVLGEIVTNGEKMGSNKIRVVREIVGEELNLLKGHKNKNTGLFNSGDFNRGDFNSGDFNRGDRNTGDMNIGNRNTGDMNSGFKNSGDNNSGDKNSGKWNSGDWNSGCYNSGYYNTGYYDGGYRNSGDNNSGNYNSGDGNNGYYNSGYCNSGDWNSGDWNKCDGSNGVFCTKEPTIKVFDEDTNMTLKEFRESKYNKALTSAPFILEEWIKYTEEEMKEDENKRLVGGYLKEYTYEKACHNWWGAMTEENKEIIISIPNFDADKFYEITGIRV